jgi:hypothetical protein
MAATKRGGSGLVGFAAAHEEALAAFLDRRALDFRMAEWRIVAFAEGAAPQLYLAVDNAGRVGCWAARWR